jgi:hypothetical protein
MAHWPFKPQALAGFWSAIIDLGHIESSLIVRFLPMYSEVQASRAANSD